ncbi:MOSC N-terminal beta barrel domain-containing protein [Leptolyngbya sp. FACHB-321]|uniref:MOSC domain-containing protein n=1 Tax=Leptolyngbya sp. FACHB-321 TaxID=2692807 RepID=UPI001F54D7BC|nr:MOSC N-terminal beta barrel domain-containing protein [Leptolyngbya sp. FACHB-321]
MDNHAVGCQWMPELAQIFVYPIKALDGVAILQTTVLPSGALQYDREFAIVDAEGNVINGKRTAEVHRIRSSFDLETRTIALRIEGEPGATTFHLDVERSPVEQWLSAYFGFAVTLLQNTETGFPDDTNSPGPTVISTETLRTIADWFPNLSLEAVRRRFRSNLEITGVEPFWEDCLFGSAVGEASLKADRVVPFHIGNVQFAGVNPCQRCIVVTRDAMTGEPYPHFQKVFVAKRKETLPEWVEASRFNHFYRLAANTRVVQPQAGATLRVGDTIALD